MCEVCEQEKDAEAESGDSREPPTIWMCLKCGHRVSDDACALVCVVALILHPAKCAQARI